ncbi:MAG: SUMF1/EgtB/PvdO family nonheme iron enzyme [Planctomycetota bacterium]
MKKLIVFGLFLNAGLLLAIGEQLVALAGPPAPPRVATENGDTNGDGARDIGDAVHMLSWLFQGGPQPVPIACADNGDAALEARVAELERKLAPVELGSYPGVHGDTLRISGVNVQIVNGTNRTGASTGRGNLIVGYNELREGGDNDRRGSHNIVVGESNNYVGYGGIVAGVNNEIRGRASTITGGAYNLAGGDLSSISGGGANQAMAPTSVVGGGARNRIEESAFDGTIFGGADNTLSQAGSYLPVSDAASALEEFDGFTFVEMNTQGQPEYTHDRTGLRFVRVSEGTFYMGSPADEVQRRSDEGPVHPVRVGSFLIAKYEVSKQTYETVMAGHASLSSTPSGDTDMNRPVTRVSWDDLHDADGFLARTGFVLPTEAQWEFACRAGTEGPFAGTGNAADMAWYNVNSGFALQNIGTKLANQFGLHDMHGNVLEWTADTYHADFYTGLPTSYAALEPLSSATSTKMTTRGGGAADPAVDCRSALRFGLASNARDPFIGFRPIFVVP